MHQKILFSLIIGLSFFALQAQQVVLPLQMNAVLMAEEEVKGLKAGVPDYIDVDVDSSEFIILDDFSYNSHRPNDHIWKERAVYINRNFPINPGSIGVASFDGLDEFGYPYNFITTTSYGPCDTLTTLPIRLDRVKKKDDPIYLSFLTQPKGKSQNPNSAKDSIFLEFYQPYLYDTTIDFSVNPPDTTIDSTFVDRWFWVWGREGNGSTLIDTSCKTAFRMTTIPVSSSLYQRDFKFRFRTYGNTSGNIDLWHLDYVVLSSDANGHNNLGDYMFIDDIGSLIENYESMPWFHYVGNESTFSKGRRIAYRLRNTFSSEVSMDLEYRTFNSSGVSIDDIGIDTITTTPIPANSCFRKLFPVGSDPTHTFIFENSSVPKDSTTYFIKQTKINRRIGSIDLIQANNEVDNYQIFGTYYGYDDGSAEAGYGVKSDNGEVAVQYFLPEGITDTLTSIYIHFNPVVQDRSAERFRLTVWANDNGQPGDIIYENSKVSSPVYSSKGVNYFERFFLENYVILSDTFYVGYQKITGDVMNIGYDLNRKKNNKLYYNIGNGWKKSSAVPQSVPRGALMIRPSFRYMDEVVVGVEEVVSETEIQELPHLLIYPNPVNDILNIGFKNPNSSTWNAQIFSLEGRLVGNFDFEVQSNLNVSDFSKGMYILRVTDEATNQSIHSKFLVTH